MNASTNYFARLNEINVSSHIEKKGGFAYLSWPFAVAQLRLADPTATWEVRWFDGLPFLHTDAGVFVEVAVTVQGITLSQIHPVLDGRNRPILAPTAFDINSSIQRCLVKAIALHGLGLYIYAGEDLPQISLVDTPADTTPAAPPAKLVKPKKEKVVVPAPIPTGGLDGVQQDEIKRLASEVGTGLDRLLTYFGVKELGEIPAVQYQRVIRSLENRRAA